MTLTPEQLEALAVYRTHKNCQCQNCQIARIILKEDDTAKWQRQPCE